MGRVKNFIFARIERYAGWPTWRLIFSGLVFLGLFAFFVRQNNLEARKMYDSVLAADANGGEVRQKLQDLQAHTFSHMNSGINQPVQLIETYNRDAKRAIEDAKTKLSLSQSAGSDIYLKAQQACERTGVPYSVIAECTAQYALSNNPGIAVEDIKINLPDKSLYTYSYIAPKFSFDAAGICLLIAMIFFLGALIRMLLGYIFRKIWRRRERRYYFGKS